MEQPTPTHDYGLAPVAQTSKPMHVLHTVTSAIKASDDRQTQEQDANYALLGYAMFHVLLERFVFALYNRRDINPHVRAGLCKDYKRGLYHTLVGNAMPVIIRREQIDISSLCHRDDVTADVVDVIWRDKLADIEVAGGRHRKSAYIDFIAYLEKVIKKSRSDLAKNEGKTGPVVEQADAASEALIALTQGQLDGLGSWLGAFYDEGECSRDIHGGVQH